MSFDKSVSKDPQNPYQSYLVEASAGSGKTYQLAQRYIYLVASGAHAPSILTITFTKKAAHQMRSRILTFSETLQQKNSTEQQAFYDSIHAFHKDMTQRALASGLPQPPKPRSIEDVAAHIREYRNELSIFTIDSLFYKWLKRYPHGSFLAGFSEKAELVQGQEWNQHQQLAWQRQFVWPHKTQHSSAFQGSPYDSPLNHYSEMQTNLHAFLAMASYYKKLFLKIPTTTSAKELGKVIIEMDDHALKLAHKNTKPYDLFKKDLVTSLSDYIGSDLWQKLTAHSQDLLADLFQELCSTYDLSSDNTSKSKQENHGLLKGLLQAVKEQLLTCCKPAIEDIISTLEFPLKTRKAIGEALDQNNAAYFCKNKWITQKGKVSAVKISDKKRREHLSLLSSIEKIESHIQQYNELQYLLWITISYYGYHQCYVSWKKQLSHLKKEHMQITYEDITTAVSDIFSTDHPMGEDLFYLIQKPIQHLLMDELQDTNTVQWNVFARLASELLATQESHLPRTVFMVGDPKQSLYGFREASPSLMKVAQAFFKKRSLPIVSLKYSYRSSPLLLAYIAEICNYNLHIDHFTPMTAAQNTDHQLHGTALSSISILPRFYRQPETKTHPVNYEATYLAHKIKQILSCPHNYPVKENRTLRNIKASDIVILYRNNTHAAIFEKALKENHIATHIDTTHNLFPADEICDLLALMKFLLYPSNSLALLQVCRCPIMGIDEKSILAMIQYDFKQRHAHSQVLQKQRNHEDVSKSFLERLRWLADGTTKKQLIYVERFLNTPKDSSWIHAFFELVAQLNMETQYRHYYLSLGGVFRNKASMVRQNIHEFRSQSFKLATKYHHHPFAVHDHLHHSVKEGTCLTENNSTKENTHNAVELMSIHKAKGLEFPMVCLSQSADTFYETSKGKWQSIEIPLEGQTPNHLVIPCWLLSHQKELRSQTSQISLFDDIFKQLHTQLYEEATRILYVALTRSSQYLVISAHEAHNVERKKENASHYLAKDIQPFYDVLKKGLHDVSQNSHQNLITYREETSLLRDLADLAHRKDKDNQDHDHLKPVDDIELISKELWDYRKNLSLKHTQDTSHKPTEVSTEPEDQDTWIHAHNHLWLQAQQNNSARYGYELQTAHSEQLTPYKTDNTKQSLASKSSSFMSSELAYQIRLKTLKGEYIHYLLERALKKRQFSLLPTHMEHDLWGGLQDDPKLFSMKKQAEKEAQNSYTFLAKYLSKAKHIWTELALSSLQQGEQTLTIGRVDLLVEFCHTLEIIDFKTESIDNRDLCDTKQVDKLQAKYGIQLSRYKDSVEKIFANKEVKTYVFFTAICQFLPLS